MVTFVCFLLKVLHMVFPRFAEKNEQGNLQQQVENAFCVFGSITVTTKLLYML